MKKSQYLLLGLLIILIGIFFLLNLDQYTNLQFIKAKQSEVHALYLAAPYKVVLSFFALYVLFTGLSLPGATLLTLIAGAVFDLYIGILLVSFASSIGATLAFWASRYLFRDIAQKKFSASLGVVNRGLAEDGGYYLFTLRLVPILPFFLINIAMGLTTIRSWLFYSVSQIGMLPATILYVNAGTQLARIESIAGIISPSVLVSLALLGIFPLCAKKLTDYLKLFRNHRLE